MSDLVGNPEDRFSHNEAQFGSKDMIVVMIVSVLSHCYNFYILAFLTKGQHYHVGIIVMLGLVT